MTAALLEEHLDWDPASTTASGPNPAAAGFSPGEEPSVPGAHVLMSSSCPRAPRRALALLWTQDVA